MGAGVRIIAGESRGRRLLTPVGQGTRPTADRVRESLFNIIAARVPGASVLDLFAGSGAMGLEAISRGARRAVFVDSDRKAADVLRRNIAAMRAQDRACVLHADWRTALLNMGVEPFTLVFLDPPYAMASVYGEALRALGAAGLLAPGGVAVLECVHGADIALPDAFEAIDRRRYGATDIIIAQLRQEAL